jgi:hypothetical protein
LQMRMGRGTATRLVVAVTIPSVLVTCATSGPPEPAQESPRPVQVEVISTVAVGAQTIAGVVLDRSNSEPIEGAQVVYGAEGQGTLTDSLGLFRLVNVPGATELVIQFVGYRWIRVPLAIHPDSGYVGRFSLEPTAVCISSHPDPNRNAITVSVRDALTGRPPNNWVRLSVRSGAAADTAVGSLRRMDPVILGAGRYFDGFRDSVDVRVFSPGYRPWKQERVSIVSQPCGYYAPQHLNVWLLPE